MGELLKLKVTQSEFIFKGDWVPNQALYAHFKGIFLYIPVDTRTGCNHFNIRVYARNKWFWANSRTLKYRFSDGTDLLMEVLKWLAAHPQKMHNIKKQLWQRQKSRNNYRLTSRKPNTTTSYDTVFRTRPGCGTQFCKSQLEIKQQAVRPEKYHYERMGGICAY